MTVRRLPIVVDDERTALQARWPEPVLALTDDERERCVRAGGDSVILEELEEVDGEQRKRRGFVRAVLTVPLGHPRGAVYGVFVEVDRAGYQALKAAHASKARTRVWGKLATRMPFLEEAFGAEVEIEEDGSTLRCRVVSSKSALLRDGPAVGALR